MKAYFEANPLNTETRKPTDDFHTAEQTADFLGISKATIYSKVSRRELPVMKRGKRLYFSQDELKEVIREVFAELNIEQQPARDGWMNATQAAKYLGVSRSF